ncbi:hypothetical protein C0Q70_03629 [Pomacea canaliculata]|uniref:Chloride channel protein n=1 Tax=Pomacea canaliculata TaxID=400727 RepID=A0A2T7PT88_POMCA|nr:hypothetical protein C0Q70_03629 [Pomacea canaliculata]
MAAQPENMAPQSENMSERQNFGFEQTLLYGHYKRDLGTFAKFQAKRLKKQDAPIELKIKKPYGLLFLWDRITWLQGLIFSKIGEDWVFLTVLGSIMGALSFATDILIEKCMEAKFWVYQELKFSVALQFFIWVSYSVLLMLFAAGFSHVVSPQSVGSGIPEMKTILRGVVLKEYLTFRTLVAKVVGLCATLSSTLSIGKEGPFVHIASMVAALLGKCTSSFRGLYENEARRLELLAAACAVGVASTYAAPIGGLLFSIEVTTAYFAVRNYTRGFYSSVCAAVVFRVLEYWSREGAKLSAMFLTNFRPDNPFDALELFAFSSIGVVCGFAGALFILMHRRIVRLIRQHKKVSVFLQKNRFIYPGAVTLVIASLTFPPGFGQFFAGLLPPKAAIKELFSNFTWTGGQAENLDEEIILSHWIHPWTNVHVTLVLFTLMHFLMACLCNTLPLPVGVFVPVFTVGAGFGRLVGESMAAWFPEGIPVGDSYRLIVPGGYAVVGAASFAGAVTRSISTSVMVFEMTGQISHVLPAVISVLIANFVANMLQPSFYDSIIRLRRLPYLPDIQSSRTDTWRMFVEDIMIRDVKFVPFTATYRDLQDLLLSTKHRTYPLVNNLESRTLLGSIQRYELERMLLVHLSPDTPVYVPDDSPDDNGSPQCPLPSAPTGLTPQGGPIPRFQVTRVDEDAQAVETVSEIEEKKDTDQSPNLNVISQTSVSTADNSSSTGYNTVNVPLRSILKKSASSPGLSRCASTGDMKDELNQFYRKLSRQRRESRIEDRPFKITSARSSSASLGKKVKLPPVARRMRQLTQMEVHSLFSLLGLNHAYVTNIGHLVGVVGLQELRNAIQGQLDSQAANKGKKSNMDDDEEEEVAIDMEELEIVHNIPPTDEYRLHEVTSNSDNQNHKQGPTTTAV